VRESARRQGLARALVQTAFEHAAARGCRRIELDVNEQNAEAVHLYEAVGFSGASKHAKGRDLLMGRQLGR
jgi:ribosomal protein S18 acetylase RimI-like enzyme